MSGKYQDGFTILELMVALSTLAIILLVAAAGILSFSDSYMKGVNQTKTQQAARSVLDDIVASAQFSPSPVSGPFSADGGAVQEYCIGNNSYTFTIGKAVSAPSQSALVRDTSGICRSVPAWPTPSDLAASGSTTQQEMLGNNMRLGQLQVTQNGSTVTIKVTVASGIDSVLDVPGGDWSKVSCASGSSSQYCAVSTLEATVQQRVGM